jgi:hypothetical protein
VPTADSQSITTKEDTAISFVLIAADSDNDSLKYIITQPEKGELSGTAPNLTNTPNANKNGADSFTFKVNDSKADSETATVSITITAVAPAPNLSIDKTSVEVNEGDAGTTALVFTLKLDIVLMLFGVHRPMLTPLTKAGYCILEMEMTSLTIVAINVVMCD